MKISLLLFAITVAIMDLVVPKELNFAIICCVMVIFIPLDKVRIYDTSFFKVLPFLTLVLTGFVLGLYNAERDFYRDIFIFSKVIIYFYCGLAISKYLKDISTFVRYFLIFALVSSLVHIGFVLINLGSANSLEAIRKAAGFGNDAQAIAASIFLSGMFNKSFRRLIKNYSISYKLFNFVIAVSFLLYFSRTLIVTLVVVSLFLIDAVYIRKIFSKKNKAVFKVLFVMMFFCFSMIFIASFLPPDSPFARLVEKFERIPDEVTWNAKKNQTATLEDINNNWRGYEAYQGLLKFNKGNYFQKFFGYGFGAKVDLGISMKLGGEYFEEVPILHNAYVTLLVKCGFLGVACYLWFIYQLGFSKVINKYNRDLEMYYLYQMLSGLCVATLLNTFTMRGLLGSEAATIPILLGLAVGIIERRKQTVTSYKPFMPKALEKVL